MYQNKLHLLKSGVGVRPAPSICYSFHLHACMSQKVPNLLKYYNEKRAQHIYHKVLTLISVLKEEIIVLEQVKTNITASDMTIACSTSTVTASAEQIPRTCFVIGFSLTIGSLKILDAISIAL